ncbi:MAG: hypothetical protein JNG83_02350, partial [Opitutaceae bacterium]|nr:hypothetical protein [Opitutaceae bacterium]
MHRSALVGLALATLLLPNLRGQEKPESNPASDANKEVVKLDSLIVTGTRRLDR